MIEVDGSSGEGGGQILRTTLALAAVLNREVRIYNIRAGRSEPGLRPQHLTAVRAVAEICSASLKGSEVGSTEFVFRPETRRTGQFRFDVGTAGSISLVLQTLMPVLPFLPGKIELDITGGTDVKWSPPVDYVRLVTLPTLAKMGYQGTIQVARRGYYPKGGGKARFEAVPETILDPITELERGEVTRVIGVSHSLGLPRHVAERQAAASKRVVLERGLPAPQIAIDISQGELGLGPGSGIVLCALTSRGGVLGADCLGERGKPAEEVGSTAGKMLVEELDSNGFLDRHMGDMIIPYIALAEGISEISVTCVTQHTLTNVRVAEQVAGVHFDSVGEIGQAGRLRVKGVGFM